MTSTIRSLFAKPSYVIISVIVLGASIAAQMTIVAIVDATLVRPPSSRAPAELAFVRSSLPRGTVSYPDFVDIKERNSFFSGTFAFFTASKIGLSHHDDFAIASCGVVSGSFFPTLGVQPSSGRVITEDDNVQGAEPVALVSSELAEKWKIDIGSIIKIDAAPFTVIGLLPPHFEGIERHNRPDVWVPAFPYANTQWPKGMITNRNLEWVSVAGRLKPGVTLASANAEIATIAQALQKEYPTVNNGMGLTLASFTWFQFSQDESARTMLLISGIVWLLFALAFANFFALTLLRIFTRRRELALKLALGATRAHISRWLLRELGFVSALSIATGYILSRAFLFGLRLDPTMGKLIEAADIKIDFRSVLIVAVCVFACATVVWLLSVRSACRVDLVSAIKESSSAPRRQFMVAGLYAVQFALALFLLSMAVSFVDALRTVATRRLPFRTENLLLLDLNLRAVGLNDARGSAFIDTLLNTVQQVPGVVAVGASNPPLLTVGGWNNLIVNERDPSLDPDKCICWRSEVTSGFWDAAGIPLLSGRFFTDADIAAKSPVVVINAAAARRFWPGQDAVGKSFRGWFNGPLYSVVGVVADVPDSRSAKINPLFYRPSKPRQENFMTLHIAVRQDSDGMRQAISRSLQSVWPYKNPPVLRSIHDQVALASADLATAVRLVLWVAGFATLVTGCGLYFFSAYTASQGIKDAAIRMALGANQADVILAHLRKYRLALLCGFGLGALLLISAQPAFAQFDIEVNPPKLTYILVAAVPLMVIAITGLCVPLRKIGRLNVYHTLNLSE